MSKEYIRTSVAYLIEKGLAAIKEAAISDSLLPICIRKANQVITITKQLRKPEKALKAKSESPNKSAQIPKRK